MKTLFDISTHVENHLSVMSLLRNEGFSMTDPLDNFIELEIELVSVFNKRK